MHSLKAMHPLKIVVLIVAVLFLLPAAVRVALSAFEEPAQSWQETDTSSAGILPAASSHPQARVLIMSAPISGGLMGSFAAHSWVVLKRENAPSWSRYELYGSGNRPVLNHWAP